MVIERSRQRAGRWMVVVAAFVLIAALAVPGALAAVNSQQPTGTPSSQPILEHGAGGAIAVDLSTGLELFSHNADTRMSPASTMKIVTALVAVSILPLDHVVWIEDGDLLDPSIFSNMTLEPGDSITVRDLLDGLLMQSAGDATMALARESGLALQPGATNPVGAFMEYMNAYVVDAGMTNTHFVNPVGWDDPMQYSSARDLVRASQRLLDDWLLSRIVRTEYTVIEVEGSRPRSIELVATNLLLERDDVFGIKTGTEDIARECLITGLWRGDNQIVMVVLGSEDRYADTQSVMEWVDARYRWVALGAGTRSMGATDALAAEGLRFMVGRTVVMTVDQAERLTWEVVTDRPQRGYRHGVVIFRVDFREVARLPVY